MATASVCVVMGAWTTAMVLLLGWASIGEMGWGLAAMIIAELCLLLALAPVVTEFWRGNLPSSASDCARDVLLDIAMVSVPFSVDDPNVVRTPPWALIGQLYGNESPERRVFSD